MAVKAVLSLLILLVLQAAAQDRVKYFEIGGKLELNPEYSQPITSITWKHKSNLVAEWIKDKVELEFLGVYKGRSELDKTTGVLTVNKMTKSDDGDFTVEINDRVLPIKYKAEGVRNLKEFPVDIIVRPLSCNNNLDNCTLTCGDEFKGAGPVEYSWNTGQKEKTIPIFKETKERVESFTCTVKSLFQEKKSLPLNNPFKTESISTGLVVGIVVIVLIVITGAAIVIFLLWKKPQCIQNLCNRKSDAAEETAAGTGKEAVPLNDQ